MRSRGVEWLRHLTLFAVVCVFCVPLVELLRTSLERNGFRNYTDALTQIDLGRNLLNSAIVTGCTVALVLLITLPAAFAFSKMRFPLRNALFLLILLALMIPSIAIAVPVVQIVRAFDWFNRYSALIFPYTALLAPFGLVLAKGFMDQLPKEMQEAGLVDGCSVFQSFLRIYLPLTRPIAMIVVVFTFLGSWNEFLFAMIFMRKAEMQMVTTIPIKFQVDFVTNMPGLFAALVIIQLPVLVLYVLFQKHFKEGLTAGAVKS